MSFSEIDVRIGRVVVEPGHTPDHGRLAQEIAQALRRLVEPQTEQGAANSNSVASLIAGQIVGRLPAQPSSGAIRRKPGHFGEA